MCLPMDNPASWRDPDLLTMDEVAGYLRVGPGKVRELLRAGKLRGVQGLGRGWRVKREDLRRFMEELWPRISGDYSGKEGYGLRRNS